MRFAELRRTVEQLLAAPAAAPDTPETPRQIGASGQPPFESSWGPRFTSAVKFYKDRGVVYLAGLVTHGTGANSTPIFTLPEGYRPPQNILLNPYTQDQSGTMHPEGALFITTAGVVMAQVDDSFAPVISLDGISFLPA